MDGARIRGHPFALAAIAAMIRSGPPGAVLFVGPASVGKTTLALDLASGLLCTADDPPTRPCGTCRSCRLVAKGSHPDVHRLGPEGPGRQVVIGGSGAKARGIRDLIGELALLPVEGGARVAIIESAHRMNEDAQAALLKTLEEPPPATTIVLCADAEEPLLPTIRSRCARVRLGPVGVRDIETFLAEVRGVEAPVAARVARIAEGRPGAALAWATTPDGLRERDAIARSLLDLAAARPAERLAGIRALAILAGALAAAVESAMGPPALDAEAVNASGRGKRTMTRRATSPPDASEEPPGEGEADDAAPARVPAAERRRAADALVALWAEVARDIALVQRGLDASVRDLALLDDTRTRAAQLDVAGVSAFLDRLGRAAVLIAGNVAPELVLDDLALAWPEPRKRAA